MMRKFCPVTIAMPNVGIERYAGPEHLQATFSDRFIGGGVLRGLGGQEECAFVSHPELIAVLFVTPWLFSGEALEIAGALRCVDHNLHAAYRSNWSLAVTAQYCRLTPALERCPAVTVLMPSLSLQTRDSNFQYEALWIKWHMRQCLAALLPSPYTSIAMPSRSFVTGLWGCGFIYRRSRYVDVGLKFLIQWMCCSMEPSVSKMVFCPFDQSDAVASDPAFLEVVSLLAGNVSVGEVFYSLVHPEYRNARSTFGYILQRLHRSAPTAFATC
jgi:hypothetical protein